jgi:hypothetical protein
VWLCCAKGGGKERLEICWFVSDIDRRFVRGFVSEVEVWGGLSADFVVLSKSVKACKRGV